jgi:hypothetical protein
VATSRLLPIAAGIVAAALLIACGRDGGAAPVATFATPLANSIEPHTHTEDGVQAHSHLTAKETDDSLEAVIVPSELTVGANRFAVGIFDAAGAVVNDATVHFHYYDLSDPQNPTLESEADATRLQTPDGTTVFAHEREFLRAGSWGVGIEATFPDGHTAVKRIRFDVLPESPTVKVGEPAPVVDTPTLAAAGGELASISSAPVPNRAFYAESLSDALKAGEPTVVLFATPAFCQTRFCGPSYDLASELQQQYGDRVTFVHVEIYTGLPNPAANGWEIAPAMAAFGLSTEPWLYLIDRQGRVAYRVEGLFTVDEIEPHLKALLQS